LRKEWVDEIMEVIIESLEIEDPLSVEEKDAMENIIINAIALYQAKITEHLQIDKNSPIN
jgi:hypothetical protein